MIAFYDYFLGPDIVDHLKKQAEMKHQSLTYTGERKNCNFERFVTAHKEQHTILEGLTENCYNGLDDGTKVTRLMDGVKLDSLHNVKSMILANCPFFKEF